MLTFLMFISLYVFEGEPKASSEGCPPESEFVTKASKVDIMEVCYRRGTQIKHGPLRSYELNGRLRYETFYADGVRHGLNRYWEKDGRLSARGVYEDGKEVGFTVQFGTSSAPRPQAYGYRKLPAEAGIYRQWSWRGPKETWYRSVSSFKGGTRHGRHLSFHKNGRLGAQRDYFEGELGRTMSWDDSGRFLNCTCYDADALKTVWNTASYEVAITRSCPAAERLGKDMLPAGDQRIPPPSAATHDLVPPEVQADFPDLLPPKPPPYPPGPDDVGPPEVETYSNPEDR